MSQILIYCRAKIKEPLAERTVTQLAEQLYLIGHQVDITHSLNIPRLILNNYHTLHLVIEKLPLTALEAFHLTLCKALQKNTLVSLLDHHQNMNQISFLRFVGPDALSLSQTNYFKYYRSVNSLKFILAAWPLNQNIKSNSSYQHKAYLVPLLSEFDEIYQYKTTDVMYFDGQVLLKKYSASQLRKKWADLIQKKIIPEDSHLILSPAKLADLIDSGHLTVLLNQHSRTHTDFTYWLQQVLNKKNLVVLNENQSTGFSQHWTSGQNCFVVPSTENFEKISELLHQCKSIQCSRLQASDLYDTTVNELSRLYSKLSQQKTTLLTSRSAKL